MAEKTNYVYPLASTTNGYTRSDGESLVSADELKRKKRIKLSTYIGIFIVFQMAIGAAMGLTVLKVKSPKVRLGTSTLSGFTSSATLFQTTFKTQIRVKNTNWGPYKFDEGVVTFMYQGTQIGTVIVPNGTAGFRGTKKINVNVNLNAAAFQSSDRVVTLTSEAKLNGKVTLMLMMKKKKTASMICTIQIDASVQTVKSLQCK